MPSANFCHPSLLSIFKLSCSIVHMSSARYRCPRKYFNPQKKDCCYNQCQFFTYIERILNIKYYYLLSFECQFEHTFEHPCLCNVTMTHVNRLYLAPMASVCIISHILLQINIFHLRIIENKTQWKEL